MGALFFQQDGLARSLQDLERVMGDHYPEAVAGVAASAVGAVGVSIEAAGVGISSVAQAMEKAAIAEARAVNALTLGKGMIRFGGVTTALSGVVEGVQYRLAAQRNERAGDSDASARHVWASRSAALGGAAGGLAAYVGSSSLLGFLGLALALGLCAYALAQSARKLESTALEQWCRRCYFGNHDETPSVWWNSAKTVASIPAYSDSTVATEKSRAANNDRDIAISALNAAILGLEVEAMFLNNPQPTLDIPGENSIWGQAVAYRICLPNLDFTRSAYAMYVGLHSYKGEHIAVVRQLHASAIHKLSPPQRHPSYEVDTNATIDPSPADPVVAGTLLLAFLERDITSATVRVRYWPDKSDIELYADLTHIAYR